MTTKMTEERLAEIPELISAERPTHFVDDLVAELVADDRRLRAELAAIKEFVDRREAVREDIEWSRVGANLLVQQRAELAARTAEVERLREVLEPLVTACRADFEPDPEQFPGQDMDYLFPDEDAVGGGAAGDMALTFGMIRRAYAALNPEPAP